MAGRDINIPFGPDKTAPVNLSSIVPEIESPAEEENVQEAVESAEQPEDAGVIDVAAADEPGPVAVEDGWHEDEQYADEQYKDEQYEDAEPEVVEAPAGGGVDVQASLIALKDSIDQGRKLKARERERDEFSEKLDADREELADREDILANYVTLVSEQDDIIYQNTQQREARKAELSQAVAERDSIADSLERMREDHDAQLQPLQTALGRAKATAEQAKNDERSRKSELNAVESEKRRAEGGDDSAMVQARLEVAQQAYEEAASRSEKTKGELDKAQKRFDELREQIEQIEAPLERSIEDLDGTIEELKESVNRLGDVISAARKRRQYCDTVYQYPDETAKLRASVEADEETIRRMDEENDELRDLLAESKERSKIAKFAIAGVVALIIIIIIVFIVVGGK